MSADAATGVAPRRARRWIIGIVVTLGIAMAVGFVLVGRPLLAVGTAYKAKMLCSEVFVAGRRAHDVLRELAIDDLGLLRLIGTNVDTAEGSATARLFPLRARAARLRGATGCTLVSHASNEPHSSASTRSVERIPDSVATLPPESRRRIDAVLDEAFAEPDPDHPRRTRAVVVMRHGAVVAERYAPGVSADRPMPGWSMAKSVLSALVGIAVGEGKLALDGPVKLRAWSTPGDERSRISVSDLLHMSSGLRFDEAQGSVTSDILRMLFSEPDMAAFAASEPLEVQPGTRWKYSTGTSVILSRVLREALGDSAYRRLPREALFDPLGMTHAVIETDESGTFVASSYMYATAREWARFGQLYLQDGAWNGKRILPEGWVAFTRTPAPADTTAGYGAHFWLKTPREYRGPVVPLPPGVFHAVGHEGQFLTIVPSHDVVIVRLGRTRYPNAWAHDRFIAAVLAALPQ